MMNANRYSPPGSGWLVVLLLCGALLPGCDGDPGGDAGDTGDTARELNCTPPTCMPGDRKVTACGGDALCVKNTYRSTNRCGNQVTCEPPTDTGIEGDGSSTGDTDLDGTEAGDSGRCGAPDEVYVEEACEQCGPSGGCTDRGPACRATCDDTGCRGGFTCDANGVCVRACP